VDVAQPPASARLSAARAPNSTQGKPNFAATADGIPDAAHTSTHDKSTITSVAALPASNTDTAAAITTKTSTTTATTSTFSVHDHEDGANADWELAPLGPHAKGKVAASGGSGHHVAHCRFDLLLSDSEREEEINASEFDDM
jgi:hypothetical protein